MRKGSIACWPRAQEVQNRWIQLFVLFMQRDERSKSIVIKLSPLGSRTQISDSSSLLLCCNQRFSGPHWILCVCVSSLKKTAQDKYLPWGPSQLCYAPASNSSINYSKGNEITKICAEIIIWSDPSRTLKRVIKEVADCLSFVSTSGWNFPPCYWFFITFGVLKSQSGALKLQLKSSIILDQCEPPHQLQP